MNSLETPIKSEIRAEHEDLSKAGILNRIIAKTIDFIIVGALFMAIPTIGYFAGIAYLLIADGLFEGRSIGKRLMGLRVVIRNADTKAACSFKESIIRNFPFGIGYILFGVLKGIPLIGWIFAIIILSVIVIFEGLIILGNEKGIRFGDEIAKTQVIEER